MCAEHIFEGRKLAAVIEKARLELELQPGQLNYDVLCHGSRGFFGLVGRRNAKIRVYQETTRSIPKNVAPTRIQRTTTGGYDRPGSIPSNLSTQKIGPQFAAAMDLDALERGHKILAKIVQHLSAEAKIIIENKSDKMLYEVKGGNAAVMIGKKGHTLEAINFIIDKAVNKNCSKRIRVQVDIEGYLKNKKFKLEQLAERMWKKAVHTGKIVTIEKISAQERRIVHMALKKKTTIRTQSRGSGPIRDLMIIPCPNESSVENKTHYKKNSSQNEA